MRDHAVATKDMVLLINIPHDLPVRDWVVSILHVAAITLIEAITEQRDHRLSDRLLIVGPFAQFFQLMIILPGYNAHRENAQLLHPVFLNDFLYGIPIHKHPSSLSLHPGTSTVVIGSYLYPGAVIVVIDGALNPCSVVVIPDGRRNVGDRDSDGCDSGVIGRVSAARRSLAIVDDKGLIPCGKICRQIVEECSVGRGAESVGDRV